MQNLKFLAQTGQSDDGYYILAIFAAQAQKATMLPVTVTEALVLRSL